MPQTKTEAKLCNIVMKFLRHKYPDGFWYKTNDRYRAGIPDILGWRKGDSYAIELKAEDGVLSKLQEHTLSEMSKAGVYVAVCKTLDDVQRLIDEGGTYDCVQN